MESKRNELFAVGAGREVAGNKVERRAIRDDFEHRIPRDSHIAVSPFPIVQLDDCFTRDEFAFGVDDLPFSSRRIHRSPKFIALITFYHSLEGYGRNQPLVNE